MQKLTAQDKKTIEKYKKRVQKRYPGAFLTSISNGHYSIITENDDLTVTDVLSELLVPYPNDVLKAWELAAMSVKITQNLDRTHPLRLEGMKMEDKIARIEARKAKKDVEKELKKSNSDIYF